VKHYGFDQVSGAVDVPCHPARGTLRVARNESFENRQVFFDRALLRTAAIPDNLPACLD
jgi:hypothetical protein